MEFITKFYTPKDLGKKIRKIGGKRDVGKS